MFGGAEKIPYLLVWLKLFFSIHLKFILFSFLTLFFI